ncbi:hypothetical protein GYMLUDRAFT_71506 [Collybiopsis luxurians FD-317 M1]|uniref:Uncharacterized protein n=1 Tax=Collybiopsis luxurians FD-317 M1 TaxID=944289 RepID=A0A0D0BIX6_9AGAR|nr:hypothetical protein GYMLUDRAFT_71506 [Collybiopsis luxurians FD-317 M1]
MSRQLLAKYSQSFDLLIPVSFPKLSCSAQLIPKTISAKETQIPGHIAQDRSHCSHINITLGSIEN